MTQLTRFSCGTVLAFATSSALLISLPAESQEYISPMTEDIQKAIGANQLVANSVDENGKNITYLRQDLYDEVQAAQTEVQFPLELKQIDAVLALGTPDEMIIIRYEVNPPKTMQCRWVGSTYTCYTN